MLAGRYRLIERIGRGGMGVVWRAVDTLLDREAAVKEVTVTTLPETARGELYRRTLREARTAARLRHPNVVTLFDVVEEDDRPWIVMELVHARALDHIVAAEGPMAPERAAHIGRQVLAALTAAHAKGVLHRDVKPGNVLVGEGDRVTLTDFGIATIEGDTSITQSGQLVGSPAYLGPERAAGEPASAASDLWALGATLFMAVEGKGPYDREGGAMATLGAILTQEPPPAPHAGALAPVIDRLLVRDPAQRLGPDGAAEMLDAVASGRPMATPTMIEGPRPLGAAAGAEPVPYGPPAGPTGPQGPYGPPGASGPHPPYGPAAYTPPPGAVPVPRRRSRTPFVVGGIAVVGVLALVAIGGLYRLYQSRTPSPPSDTRSFSPADRGTPISTSPMPAQSKPNGKPAVPAGFVRHKDPAGFSIVLPKSWGDRATNGNSVTYYSPDHTAYVLVDRTAQPTGNPMVNMRRFIRDARKDGKYRNSRTLSLHRLRYLDSPAAAWEFTWQLENGATVHAEDRQVVKSNGDFVAVYWQTFEKAWAKGRMNRSTAFSSLRIN